MAPSIPPLPYRPLEVKGHGVYDPATGRYYPFLVANDSSVLGKAGIRYYVRSIQLSAHNSGDQGAGSVSVTAYVSGQPIRLAGLYVGLTLMSYNVSASGAVSVQPDVLLDASAGITVSANTTQSYTVITYAEIPADVGEVPV